MEKQPHCLTPDVISFTACIQACSQAGEGRIAVYLLSKMNERGVQADAIAFSAAIQGCSNANKALSLLLVMKNQSIPLDVRACNAAIQSCATSGDFRLALSVIALMREEGVCPDSYTYTSAISSAWRSNSMGGDHCKEVFQLLDELMSANSGISLDASTAPCNAAIKYFMRSGSGALNGIKVYRMMLDKGVPRNIVTYTTLLTGLAKSGLWRNVLEIYLEVEKNDRALPINLAILGSALCASEQLGHWQQSQELFMAMRAMATSRHSSSPPLTLSTSPYNTVIAALAKAGKHEEAMSIFALMKSDGIAPNTESFNHLIASCKSRGLWPEALALLDDLEAESKVNAATCANTHTMSTAISICLAGQQWALALDLLDKMERLKIPPNRVTYNSLIEVLDGSGEKFRSELVYQSALRAKIYNHWSSSSDTNSHVSTMDLHHFPVAVARTAVMHVLGEMASQQRPVTSLTIITGRGNHADVSGRRERGVLKKEMRAYLQGLGLAIEREDETSNPGRVLLSKASIEAWFEEQKADDAAKRSSGSGSAHGNLFLSMAFAKSKSSSNVRAVCPFSSATAPSIIASEEIDNETKNEKAAPLVVGGGCPAHQKTNVVELPQKTSTHTNFCPAHLSHHPLSDSLEGPEPVVAQKMCPAHIQATKTMEVPSVAAEIMSDEPVAVQRKCPAHAAGATSSSAAIDIAQEELALKKKEGTCPAHAIANSAASKA